MNRNVLEFVTFCVGVISRRLKCSRGEIYQKLKDSGILDEYIIPSYDVLHTYSSDYIADDITEFMKEKGVLTR